MVPFLAPQGGVSWLLIWGEGGSSLVDQAGGEAEEVCPSPGGTVCHDSAEDPAFPSGSSKVAAGFLVFLYLVVHSLP